MERYYDHKSVSCEGCYFLRDGAYPSGEPYEACRWFGYILSPKKGVSPEKCLSRKSIEEGKRWEAQRTEKKRKSRR